MESQAAEGSRTGFIWVYNLDQLLGDEPTLLSLEIKKEPLASFASARPNGRRYKSANAANLAHHYVVITALGRDGKKVAFKVEKVDDTQAEIHAELRSDPRAETLHVNIEVVSVDLGNSDTRIDLGSTKVATTDLKAILLTDGERYSLVNSNCQHYAFAIKEKIVDDDDGCCLPPISSACVVA